MHAYYVRAWTTGLTAVKNTPGMILHLDTIGNGIAHEALAKSDKYLNMSNFL